MLYSLDNMSTIPVDQLNSLTEDDFEMAQTILDVANKIKDNVSVSDEERELFDSYVKEHTNSESKLHRYTAACACHALSSLN